MDYKDQLKNILKNEGLRFTKQRQQVWDEIRRSSEHRDAEQIYIQINKIARKKQDLKVSRATVYRTIDVLVKNNLVRKMELGDGRALYEHKIDDGSVNYSPGEYGGMLGKGVSGTHWALAIGGWTGRTGNVLYLSHVANSGSGWGGNSWDYVFYDNITKDSWYHVVIDRNHSSGNISMYVNGSLAGTNTNATAGTEITNSSNLYLSTHIS